MEFGAVDRLAGLPRYLTGPANLPDEAGTAIVTAAASTTAGYGTLADLRESGRLSDRATLVAVTMNAFPRSTPPRARPPSRRWSGRC